MSEHRPDGRVVPVYAITRGRTRSVEGRDMPVETLVTAIADVLPGGLDPEYRTAVELAARPVSIAEVGAALGVPIGVARVVVSDLVGAGHLAVHLPPTGEGGPVPAVLERLLEGLRARR
ncbi:DUF742 domain-containing protein [Pseudonocardia abyssalis]|uniref:DUF742 domain-containing protein n=1 Tax=Pseudonocardia abyssalis TaxID=2792008 RepID=A0ABS6V147_9PSEU|nr:DUF742 domain-containing protein [Pseudonocardia abyssalis]MBW0117905.1 DUF742 domain-containing protein [Pseudonocardia abyssalis]MBW0138244.1 DUF742 domain-containing protein [Pseudonocardia abyssalis]